MSKTFRTKLAKSIAGQIRFYANAEGIEDVADLNDEGIELARGWARTSAGPAGTGLTADDLDSLVNLALDYA